MSSYSKSGYDTRAVNETCVSMMKNGMITYHSMVLNLDLYAGFIYEFDKEGIDINEVLTKNGDTYKACIDAAN